MARPKKDKAYRYRNVGRKTKMTEEVIKKLEESFAIGANVKQACFYGNISTRTYYTWIEDNPALLHRFEELREKLPLKAKKNISEAIELGDIQLSERYLAKKEPKEWADTLKLEHSGDIGDGTPQEDKEVIDEFHIKLIENRMKRSQEKAKEDGEIV